VRNTQKKKKKTYLDGRVEPALLGVGERRAAGRGGRQRYRRRGAPALGLVEAGYVPGGGKEGRRDSEDSGRGQRLSRGGVSRPSAHRCISTRSETLIASSLLLISSASVGAVFGERYRTIWPRFSRDSRMSACSSISAMISFSAAAAAWVSAPSCASCDCWPASCMARMRPARSIARADGLISRAWTILLGWRQVDGSDFLPLPVLGQ